MDDNHLHQPLLPSATAITSTSESKTSNDDVSDKVEIASSNFGIVFRLLLILFIGGVSIWANHEASKGFTITITNDMRNTPIGEKFSLFFISNDEATRLVQGTTKFATKVLSPTYDSMSENKLIEQVNIRLTDHNLTSYDQVVVAKHFGQGNRYVIFISSKIMEYDDFRYRIRNGIQRCMAEIMVDNQNSAAAPKELRNGMIEYISNYGSIKTGVKSKLIQNFEYKCWKDKDPKVVAQFLGYAGNTKEGFIGRLNQEMRNGWDDKMVDKALDMPAQHLCMSFIA